LRFRFVKEEVMPIYEYRCQECQQTFEEWQKDFTERQAPCPVCGGKADRLISSTSFVLKGGGWYSDLYSKPGESKPGESKTGESKTDSSSAGAAPAPKAEAPASAPAPAPAPAAN
jgi:putative FmdB family regulatory protein